MPTTTRSTLEQIAVALDPSTLRHLAATSEALRRVRLDDPQQCADEMLEMLERGSKPTIGWWRRHTVG